MLLRARMQQLQQSGDSNLKQDPLQSDPFLGQNPSSDHSRQASTDSGVGRVTGLFVNFLMMQKSNC